MKNSEKKRLVSRVYMYIFLTISSLTAMWIVHTYAYADLDLCKSHPELASSSPFINIVIDR